MGHETDTKKHGLPDPPVLNLGTTPTVEPGARAGGAGRARPEDAPTAELPATCRPPDTESVRQDESRQAVEDSTRRFREAMGCTTDSRIVGGVAQPPTPNACKVAADTVSNDARTMSLPGGSMVTVRGGPSATDQSSPASRTGPSPKQPKAGAPAVEVRTVGMDAIEPAAVRHTEQQLVDLAASRKDTIPIHPPVLRQRGKRYAVIAGAGRVEADRRAGLKEITATVIPEGPEYDWLAEMVRIDENLRRVDPLPAERDELIRRRKTLWEQRHPEAVGTGVLSAAGKKSAAKRKGTCDAASQVDSFVSETARATGESKRNVQRSLARSEKASPNVAAAYECSEVSPAQVDELAKLPKDKQEAVLAKVKGKTRDQTRQAVREAQGQAHTASPSPPTPPVSSPRAVVRELVAALDAFNGPLNVVWRCQAEVVAKVGLPERTRLRDRLVKAAEILEKVGAALVPATTKPGPQKKPASGRRR